MAKEDEAAGPVRRIPLVEEVAHFSVRERTTGRVRVSTQTRLAEETVRATLESEEVEVTRVPVGRPVGPEVPTTRTEGDVTIVPVLEEILVVEKRLILKEELHLRRVRRIEEVAEPVQLRQQTAVVERFEEPPEGG